MSESAATVQNPPELKASAHLLLLEPGLVCVSYAADTPAADPQTGLPAVRLSVAPSASGFPGQVMLVGFSADGWLAAKDEAVLVRVIGGPAQILVTIYQSASSADAAPRLQILRLTQPAPAAAPAMASEMLAHVYGLGDIGGRLDEWIGERGSRRWIEGFALQPQEAVPASDVEYQAVLGRGWLSPWSEGGQFCGSRGMSLPILGLKVRLRGASAKTHLARVSATFVDGSEAGPVEGEACEAPSLAALEAFRVEILPTAARRPTATRKPPVKPAPLPARRKSR